MVEVNVGIDVGSVVVVVAGSCVGGWEGVLAHKPMMV